MFFSTIHKRIMGLTAEQVAAMMPTAKVAEGDKVFGPIDEYLQRFWVILNEMISEYNLSAKLRREAEEGGAAADRAVLGEHNRQDKLLDGLTELFWAEALGQYPEAFDWKGGVSLYENWQLVGIAPKKKECPFCMTEGRHGVILVTGMSPFGGLSSGFFDALRTPGA